MVCFFLRAHVRFQEGLSKKNPRSQGTRLEMGLAGWGLTVAVCLSLFASSLEQSCTLTELTSSTANIRQYEKDDFVADLQACLDACLNNVDCNYVEYRDPSFCLFDEDGALTIESDPTRSIYQKICAAATTSTSTTTTTTTTTTPACSSSQTSDTDGNGAFVTLTLTTSAQCEEACKVVSQCNAYVFTSFLACSLYSDESSSTVSPGSTYGKRRGCTSGKSCCFDQLTGAEGGSREIACLDTSSPSSCETLCLMIENCIAVSHHESTCKFFTGTLSKISSASVVMYEKVSPADCPTGFQFSEACTDVDLVSEEMIDCFNGEDSAQP